MRRALKLRDLALILFFLFLALLAFLFFQKKEGQILVVEIDGTVVDRVSIAEMNAPVTRTYRGTLGDVTVLFENGAASILQSECATEQCIHRGEISKAGQCIVCLPNRLSLYFEGGSVDGVTG